MPDTRTPSRVEVELSLVWAQNNPVAFAKRIADFQMEHPVIDWKHKVDLSRFRYMTLTADRKSARVLTDVEKMEYALRVERDTLRAAGNLHAANALVSYLSQADSDSLQRFYNILTV